MSATLVPVHINDQLYSKPVGVVYQCCKYYTPQVQAKVKMYQLICCVCLNLKKKTKPYYLNVIL